MDEATRRARAERLFEEYVEAQGRGAAPAEEAFLAQHEDVRDLLSSLLADRRRVCAMLGGADRDASGSAQSRVQVAPEHADSDPASELLRRLKEHGPLNTRYKLQGEIGRGGMGVVLRVFDEDLRRALAMKVVLGKDVAPTGDTPNVDPKTLGRFLEEAQVTGQLDHPGIVPVHELGLDAEGRVYFTMRLVKGEDLKRVFERVKSGDPEWSQVRALGVLLKVCEAMSYAHAKGVIHRDLKPANVMVGKFGEVYVMDWGLARVLGREDKHDLRIRPSPTSASIQTERRESREETPDSPLVTMDGDVVGTPSYMPPEQAKGQIDRLGPHSDVYSLGAMLYQLVSGGMPYVPAGAKLSQRTVLLAVINGPPAPLDQLAPNTPGELIAICEKAMARDITGRYADMTALADDLRAYLEGRVVAAYETGTWAETKKWVRRNRSLAAALAGVVGVALLGAVAFSVKANEAREAARLAQARSEDAEQRTRDARWNSYVAAVTGAAAAMRAVEPANVRRLLDEAPEEHRNWEWHYLDAASDTSLFTVEGHSVAFSPDGTRIVTAVDDHTARVWDASTGKELVRMVGHTDSVPRAVFTPDGERVVTVSADKTARVWDATTGAELLRLEGHTGAVWTATISPDGTRVVTTSDDNTARVWDAANGHEVACLVGHTDRPMCAAFSPDGSRVVTVSLDETARVWNPATGVELLRITEFDSAPIAVAVSPDGSRAVTGDTSGTVCVWDAMNGEELRRFGHAFLVTSVEFSADGLRIVSASGDSTARVWDVTKGVELVRLVGDGGMSYCAEFSADNRHVVTGSERGTTQVWDTATGSMVARLCGHTSRIESSVFSADGHRVASASDCVRVWNWMGSAQDRQLRDRGVVSILKASWRGRGRWPGMPSFDGERWATFDVDGRRIVTIGWDHSTRWWSATTGEELYSIVREPWFPIAVSPDCSKVLTQTSAFGVEAYDLVTGRTAFHCDGHTDSVKAVAFNEDGSRIITGSADKTARVWDVVSGRELARCEAHSFWVDTVALSPDGRLACSAASSVAYVWDATSGSMVASLEGHTESVNHAEFSSDATCVVTASSDNTARVWRVASGIAVLTLLGHTDGLSWAAFNRDGSRIVTASLDGTARVWDRETGREVARLECGGEGVQSAVFSPDGSCILTVSLDGCVRVWDSVSRRLRCAEVDTLRRVLPAAEQALNEALAEVSNPSSAADWLRTNPSLDAGVRRAALDLLFDRSMGSESRAKDLRKKLARRELIRRLLGDVAAFDEGTTTVAPLEEDGVVPDFNALNEAAWNSVDPDAPRVEEMSHALARARKAVVAARSPFASATSRDTLAWALFWLGRLDEALSEERAAIEEAPDAVKGQIEGYLRRMEAEIALLRDESGAVRVDALRAELESLECEIAKLEHDPFVQAWISEHSPSAK